MSKELDPSMSSLLEYFDVQDLGNGDINKGANTLAAMAITLANLIPNKYSVLTRDNRVANLGVSLLVTGSSSSWVILDEVITEVGLRQSHLSKGLSNYIEFRKRRESNPSYSPPKNESRHDLQVDAISQAFSPDGALVGNNQSLWAQVINSPATEKIQDIAKHPKFFLAGTLSRDLEKQLNGFRPGNPLIHLGISQKSDLTTLANVGSALIQGTYTSPEGEEITKANLLLTDPLCMLEKAAIAPDDRSAWLGQFLWLCDGSAGPELSSKSNSTFSGDQTKQRFRDSLTKIMSSRLANGGNFQTTITFETQEFVCQFQNFLRDMEPRIPGISGAARNLYHSLTIGLSELIRAGKPFTLSAESVEKFARHLVLRMANARATILQSAALNQRRTQIERVFNKLKKGAFCTRTIYKDLSLPASDCHSCLEWLEASKLAYKSSEKWHIYEGATLSFATSTTPLLDI